MTVLGAIHVHSSYSRDGRDSLAALRDFALQRQLRFIGLTDHAEDLDADTFDRYREECAELSDAQVTLIPGLEFRFGGLRGMHLLALGLSRWIEPATPEAFFEQARGVAGFTIAAHPVYPRYTYPAIVLERIDAIEVWNATYNTRFLPDPKAIRLLRDLRRLRPEVVAVAGLDQHDARNDRETRIAIEDDGLDPLEALRRGAFANVGRTMRFGSDADLGRARGAALWIARAVFDHVERVQERSAKWLARRRPRRTG